MSVPNPNRENPMNVSALPILPPEAYTDTLAETEAAINAVELIGQFRTRLNTLMETQGITSGVARAKYMAVMLATIKSRYTRLSKSISDAQNSEDMGVLLGALSAMENEAEHLDNVMVYLEMVLVREVLTLES